MARCPKCGKSKREQQSIRIIEKEGMCGTCHKKLYGNPTLNLE